MLFFGHLVFIGVGWMILMATSLLGKVEEAMGQTTEVTVPNSYDCLRQMLLARDRWVYLQASSSDLCRLPQCSRRLLGVSEGFSGIKFSQEIDRDAQGTAHNSPVQSVSQTGMAGRTDWVIMTF